MVDRIVVASTGKLLADRVRWARTRAARARGLIGYPALERGEALVLEPARQIHTFGLGYAIDVVFCDQGWNILHLIAGMRPMRVSRWVRSACAVELLAGSLPQELSPGERLLVSR